MVSEHELSHRQACKAVHLSSSSHRYRRKEGKDEEITLLLHELVEKHPSIGFWQSYFRLRRMGYTWNHKRVYRFYTALKLNIRRRRKRRLPARIKQALFKPEQPNLVWSIDFMADSLWDGRAYQLLNIVEDFNRKVLHVEVDISLPTLRLIRCLEMLEVIRGLPTMIWVDNGSELISAAPDAWCKDHGITLIFIQPGMPMQNGYVERGNGSIRRELLNAYVFRTLDEVRQQAEIWRTDYDEHRPHE